MNRLFILCYLALPFNAFSQIVVTKPEIAEKPYVPSEQEIIESIEEILKPKPMKAEKIEVGNGLVSTSKNIITTQPINPVTNNAQQTVIPSSIQNRSKIDIRVSDVKDSTLTNKLVYQGYQAAIGGQYEAAIYIYKQVLSSSSDNISLLYTIGTLYHKLHQLEEAKNYYKQVLVIDPTHIKALNNFISVISEINPQEALKELLRLNSINPNYSPILGQIGMIYAMNRDYQNAEIFLKKSVLISPDDVIFKYNLATMYDKQKKYSHARKLYQEVLDEFYKGHQLPQNHEIIEQRIAYLLSKS